MHLALSLVGYEDEIKAAMAYVFGTTFVCDNMDNAKKVMIIIINYYYYLFILFINY